MNYTLFQTFFAGLLFSLPLLLFTSCGEERPEEQPPTGRTLDYSGTVWFLEEAEADTVTIIEVAVADDESSRSVGLMDVYDMPMGSGMLFVFDDEAERSFWMANTPIALDIIFVNADRKIIRIHQNTRPYSERNIYSEGPAQFVVEVNAGFVLRNDIREGMRIDFKY